MKTHKIKWQMHKPIPIQEVHASLLSSALREKRPVFTVKTRTRNGPSVASVSWSTDSLGINLYRAMEWLIATAWKGLFDGETESGYGLGMSQVTDTDDDCDDVEYGPSMAYPPLFVVRTAEYCPECSEPSHVYTLGCAASNDGEDDYPVEDFHFLRRIESIPASVQAMLTRQCLGYYLDQEEGEDQRYLMNHCRCGARLDDDYLQGDVGTAFWPDTPSGFAELRLFRLPIDDAILIEANYSIGGGEYLDLENAQPW